MKFIKKHWLEILFVVLFILKCWMVHIQPLMIKHAAHDDGMFASRAYSLAKGHWLGSYNDITLSKGVIGIIFIAFNYKLHISYLFATQLLYFVACLSFIKMLKYIFNNKVLLLLVYIILLFNPISYSDAVSFVYRDGIYISFVLLLVSLTFEMFFYYKSSLKKVTFYQIILGIIIASIWYTREETLWIMPYIILAFLVTILFIIFDKKCFDKVKRILCLIGIPTIILLGYTMIISTFNYICYDRFVTNDFTSKEFKDAYGALTRIKPTNYLKRVPLNSYDRARLYELSPCFKELQSFIEGPYSSKHRYDIYKDGKKYRDFPEGFLYWTVREAVCEQGYCSNAKSTKQYYERLASEINSLCDSNKIECLPKRSSLVAPFQDDLKEEIIKDIPRAFITQLNYENVNVRIPDIKENYMYLKDYFAKYYGELTHNKIGYTNQELKSINMKLMKFILLIFQKSNYIIFIVSLAFYIFIIVMFFIPKTKFKYYKEVLLLSGLLCIYLARIVVVGYVAATEYESAIAKCQYLSPAFAIQSMFSVLAIIFGIKIVYDLFTNPNEINDVKISDKFYITKNNKRVNLAKMSIEQLDNLNYQEEIYFAKNIKTLPPFSKERNDYMKIAYQKIFQIADCKKQKMGISPTKNGAKDSIVELLNRVINKKLKKQSNLLFYEAGVGKGYVLEKINRKELTIQGCDIFLSSAAREIARNADNINLVENNLYSALGKIKSNSIDIFYADNVLEHIIDDEYEKTCKRIVNKIKTGGLAILIIPNSYVGPSDISSLKIATGNKAKGFHFMEQTFNEVVNFFEELNMDFKYCCLRSRADDVILLKNKFLNNIKLSLEPKIANIKNTKDKKRLFKLLGYNIYILEKK